MAKSVDDYCPTKSTKISNSQQTVISKTNIFTHQAPTEEMFNFIATTPHVTFWDIECDTTTTYCKYCGSKYCKANLAIFGFWIFGLVFNDDAVDSSRADGVPQPRRAQPQPQQHSTTRRRGDGAGEDDGGSLGSSVADGESQPRRAQPDTGRRRGGAAGDGAAGTGSGVQVRRGDDALSQVRRDDVLLQEEVFGEYSDKLKIQQVEASFVQDGPSSEILASSSNWRQP